MEFFLNCRNERAYFKCSHQNIKCPARMASYRGEYYLTGGPHIHGNDKEELARIDAVHDCLTRAATGRELLHVAFEEGRNA